ncbi:M10 family metallopeptidase C-terminal domain-containing protein, partial [Pararhodobacter sp. CCB-MM2]|uniref:M10 family metallopeptidase C-terminal domain-containing protein n=1 Tax=Pararhodobacter sp. CCB-MM2 TaxID=1786003 RepID=UPI001F213F91
MIMDGAGEDVVYGGDANDLIFLSDDGVIDFVFGGSGHDVVDVSGTSQNLVIDLGSLSPVGSIAGAGVVDRLFSVEGVVAGSGDDVVKASEAANTIATGAGQDTILFNSAAAADGDEILDFSVGDLIDLSAIDAVRGVNGNQSFT